MDNSSVSFRYRDYRDKHKVKLMTLNAMEFVRRFLLHVLPGGFQKIRYYGLLSNRDRNSKLQRCFVLTRTPFKPKVKKLTAHNCLRTFCYCFASSAFISNSGGGFSAGNCATNPKCYTQWAFIRKCTYLFYLKFFHRSFHYD